MEIISNISRSSQIRNALTSEKLTENTVKEEWAISWLTPEKACFLIQTKIFVNDDWIVVGNTEIKEFENSKENLKLIKSSVPEPFLTAVLSVLEVTTETKKSEKSEVLEDELSKI